MVSIDIHHNVNMVPFGTQGEEFTEKWIQDYPTPASKFYAKWMNLKTTYTFDDVWAAHNRLFGKDITVWNDSEEVFLEASLVQLYLVGALTGDQAQSLYRDVYKRLGQAVEGHEEVWETLGTNLETLVLGAFILERYPHVIDAYKKMYQNDPYILAIMNSEVEVPEQMGYPDMTITNVFGKETFEFLVKLSEV